MSASPPRPAASAALLRVLTCGSVDDGKSTLLGRLLHDTGNVFDDHLAAVERTSRAKGDARTNLALLTDGLRAEREQGITIDVAYRYFSTDVRPFVLADCPGHRQYTRNMATGASTADAAILLIDARLGVLEQTRRHASIVTLLGVPHLIVAVNKMDLVGWDDALFDRIRHELDDFLGAMGHAGDTPGDTRSDTRPAARYIPVCALDGDNLVTASAHTPWYHGPTLLDVLHTLPTASQTHHASDGGRTGARLAVQWVIRPQTDSPTDEYADFRGYGGRVAAGSFRPGDSVRILPAGQTTRIESVRLDGRRLPEAPAGRSVTLTLDDDVDISRGDWLVSADDARPPTVARDLVADLVWMSDAPMKFRGKYLIKHGTKRARAVIRELRHTLDVSVGRTVTPQPGQTLNPNDIGRVVVRAAVPLAFDRYAECRGTGSFILIDETTLDTVAAGLIVDADATAEAQGYVI